LKEESNWLRWIGGGIRGLLILFSGYLASNLIVSLISELFDKIATSDCLLRQFRFRLTGDFAFGLIAY